MDENEKKEVEGQNESKPNGDGISNDNTITTQNSEGEEIIIEENVDGDDDNEFLKSLEKIDEESNDDESNKEEEEEAIRIKNKNAEEARKRREAEQKLKEEAEAKAKAEEEAKAKEEAESKKDGEEEPKNTQKESDDKIQDVQSQVKELKEKYPDIDLGLLDKNEDFQEYLQGKWYKGGPSITEIFDKFVAFKGRLTSKSDDEIKKTYVKKSTPSIKGSGSGNGGITKNQDIYSMDELNEISKRLPFMNPQEYKSIEEKLERSSNYYRNQK